MLASHRPSLRGTTPRSLRDAASGSQALVALLMVGPLGALVGMSSARAQSSPTDLFVGPARPSVAAAFEATNAPEAFEVAHGQDGFLAVWTQWQGDHVRAARFAEDGTVLDPQGISVARTQDVDDLAVSFDGTNYLVVWMDHRSSYDRHIAAARVAADGSVLDASPRILAQGFGARRLGLARGGMGHLLVWTQDDAVEGGPDVYGMRVGSDGAALDATPFAIATGPGHQSDAQVTFDGTNFVVAWSNQASDAEFLQNDIHAARVSPAGVVLDPAGITIFDGAGEQRTPCLAFDGTSTVISWTSAPTDPADERAARLTPDGTVLDPAGFVLSTVHHTVLALERDGSRSLALTRRAIDTDRFQLHALPIGTDGVVDEADAFTVGDPVTTVIDATMAVGSTHVLVVQRTEPNGVPTVTAVARDTASASPSAPLTLDMATQDAPLLSFGIDRHLQVWAETRRDGVVLRATHLERDGTVIDANGIDVGRLEQFPDPAAVAFDGTNHLVVWAGPTDEGSRVHALRIAADGTVLDPQPIVIPEVPDSDPRARAPRVAFDGTSYLIVWRLVESFAGAGWSSLRGARIAPDGTLLDPDGFAIAPGSEWYLDDPEVDVVAHGSGFLVVNSGSVDDTPRLTLRRLAADGRPLDSAEIDVPTYDRTATRLRLISDGSKALLAWRAYAFGDARMYAVRIGLDGRPLDDCPIVVEQGVPDVSVPSLAVVDDDYLIAFSRAEVHTGHGVYVARIDRDGQRMGPNRELVPTSGSVGGNITISVFESGDVLLGTTDDAWTTPARSRVVLRSLSCVMPSRTACGAGVAAPISSDPEPLVCSGSSSQSTSCSLGHARGSPSALLGLALLSVAAAWRQRRRRLARK